MTCEQRESTVIAYVSGELSESDAAACRAHIDACAHCHAIYESYACVVDSITQESVPVPTLAESEALSRALAQVEPVGHASTQAQEPLPQGLPAMIWASLLAFATVAGVLALHAAGCFSFAATARAIGPVPIALAVVITVIVTSFLPITVAARRRPLNGMTFRR
jgi:anti-sigma factor RsiW